MTTTRHYHDDAICGACGGPLDSCRDAICLDCCSRDEEHELFRAADQRAHDDALDDDETLDDGEVPNG